MRNESGQTRGYEYTGRLLGGYWFKYQDMMHGPYARATYTKAIVRQFSEVGADSTALTYGQQSNEQMLWSVGWQVAGKYGNVRPWARATWEYDSLDKDRTVTASSNTLGGSYTRARDQARQQLRALQCRRRRRLARRHRIHLRFGHRRRAATATIGPSPSACACRSDARLRRQQRRAAARAALCFGASYAKDQRVLRGLRGAFANRRS